MSDLLRMDYINSLPQPFTALLYANEGWWWPIYDIAVDAGICRIDVCGKLQVIDFSDIKTIRDETGADHDPEDWWTDAALAQQPPASGDDGGG